MRQLKVKSEFMIPLIFLLTYLGVAMGRFPRLVLDRTGIALLGALAMILAGWIRLKGFL